MNFHRELLLLEAARSWQIYLPVSNAYDQDQSARAMIIFYIDMAQGPCYAFRVANLQHLSCPDSSYMARLPWNVTRQTMGK
jgi:hypothetical protein